MNGTEACSICSSAIEQRMHQLHQTWRATHVCREAGVELIQHVDAFFGGALQRIARGLAGREPLPG